MIELKRYRRNAVRRIAESHLPRVAQKTETRYIRYRVNQPPAAFFLEFLKRLRRPAIQRAHGLYRGCHRILTGAVLLQRRRDHAGAERLSEKQNVAPARSHISPHPLWIDYARDRVSEQHVLIANGMSADDAALCLGHLRQAPADDLLQEVRIASVREPNQRERRNGTTAHGIDIAQSVRRGDLTEVKRLVHNRREEIHSLHKSHAVL